MKKTFLAFILFIVTGLSEKTFAQGRSVATDTRTITEVSTDTHLKALWRVTHTDGAEHKFPDLKVNSGSQNNCERVADHVYQYVDSSGSRTNRSSGVMMDTSKKIDQKKSVNYTKNTNFKSYADLRYEKKSSMSEVFSESGKLSQIIYDEKVEASPKIANSKPVTAQIKISFADDCSILKLVVLSNQSPASQISVNNHYCEAVSSFMRNPKFKYSYNGDKHLDFSSIQAVSKKYSLTNHYVDEYGSLLFVNDYCAEYEKYFSKNHAVPESMIKDHDAALPAK